MNIVHSQWRPGTEEAWRLHQPAGADAARPEFDDPGNGETSRRALTRERVVAEALTVIAAEGAQSLSMRALAGRLRRGARRAVPPRPRQGTALDLILDAVLGEVDCRASPATPSPARAAALARGLRAALENHPGTAALLKTRDPLTPATLTLAEAFLAPMHAAGLPGREAALAFRLIYDYTLGFALADPPHPPNSACTTPQPGSNCTPSSAPCPPAAPPPWPPTAYTPGTATATSAPPAGLDTLLRGLADR